MISKSAENIGESAEYTVNSAKTSKNICRNLNLYSKILNNGPYTENSLKIFCRVKYRIPGYTTISGSAIFSYEKYVKKRNNLNWRSLKSTI